MSLPRYPEYKDSGVEWLGEVPAEWNSSPLKHIASFSSGGTPSKENKEFWDGDVPWASAKDLKVENLADTADHITQDAVLAGAATLIPASSVLVVVRGMILAKTFPVVRTLVPMAINQDLKGIRPKANVDGKFLAWLLRGSASESLLRLDEAGHGTKALRMDAWSSIQLPIPSLEEQTAIAAFLDRETAKIDALVAEQEKLLTLLAEKRQATISHAITKGLDPDVPMKDAGVEWLEEVPAHWEVGNLKRFAEIIDCKHHTVEFLDDGLPIVSIRELRDNRIDLSNAKLTSPSEWDFLREGRIPQQGDLIFCRNASVGAVGYVGDEQAPFCMGQDVCLIRPQTKNRFMHFQVTCRAVTNQIEALLVGATIRRANVEEIRNLVVTWPPAVEQGAIAIFLEAETARLDALTAEATRAIALLKERRTALISAAVTGKIDVRHIASPEPA